MILSYRGFDTLGESCVLFLAVSSVMMLLQRDGNNTDEQTLLRLRREDAIERTHPDNILRKSAKLLSPFILLFSLYVLFNGETSPGGGFSGGAVLGGGLILYSVAYGPEQLSRLLTRSLYDGVRITGLMAYALTYGIYIFAGANGITVEMEWMMTVIDLAVGLVVACTIYGFYTMGLLIFQPQKRKVRNGYIMMSVLLTAGLSFASIAVAAAANVTPACTLVRFSSEFSISLRIDGASMDPNRAAKRVGREDGYALLRLEEVAERLKWMRRMELPTRQDVLRRLGQMAFGRVSDAAKLANREMVESGELDLSDVAELKITDKGTEMKLIDRIQALETLWGLLDEDGEDGMDEESILPAITATVTNFEGMDYRSIASAPTEKEKELKRVEEGSIIPTTTIRTQENLVRLHKRGRMLVASYEAIRFQRLDLFSVTLRQIGAYIGRMHLQDAINVLCDGDGNNNAAKIYTIGTNPISGTKGTLTYDALLDFWSQFDPYTMAEKDRGAQSAVRTVLHAGDGAELPGDAGRGNVCGNRCLSGVSKAGGSIRSGRSGAAGASGVAGGRRLLRVVAADGGAYAEFCAVHVRVLGGLRAGRRSDGGEYDEQWRHGSKFR